MAVLLLLFKGMKALQSFSLMVHRFPRSVKEICLIVYSSWGWTYTSMGYILYK